MCVTVCLFVSVCDSVFVRVCSVQNNVCVSVCVTDFIPLNLRGTADKRTPLLTIPSSQRLKTENEAEMGQNVALHATADFQKFPSHFGLPALYLFNFSLSLSISLSLSKNEVLCVMKGE